MLNNKVVLVCRKIYLLIYNSNYTFILILKIQKCQTTILKIDYGFK